MASVPAQQGDFPGPDGNLVAARGQDGKAGKQSGGVFPQGPQVLEGHDPSPDQPVTLRNQVLERDKQA